MDVATCVIGWMGRVNHDGHVFAIGPIKHVRHHGPTTVACGHRGFVGVLECVPWHKYTGVDCGGRYPGGGNGQHTFGFHDDPINGGDGMGGDGMGGGSTVGVVVAHNVVVTVHGGIDVVDDPAHGDHGHGEHGDHDGHDDGECDGVRHGGVPRGVRCGWAGRSIDTSAGSGWG